MLKGTVFLLILTLKPDDTHIAAGMSDGTLSVRRRQPKPSDPSSDPFSVESLRTGAFETFLGGSPLGLTLGQGIIKGKAKAKPIGDVDEFKVESRRKRKLRAYDRLLKNFKYGAALDSVLMKVNLLFTLNLSKTHFFLLLGGKE